MASVRHHMTAEAKRLGLTGRAAEMAFAAASHLDAVMARQAACPGGALCFHNQPTSATWAWALDGNGTRVPINGPGARR